MEELQRLARRVACEQCPLRIIPRFRPFTEAELGFVSRFKLGEISAEAGALVLSEGTHSAQLYTILSGWTFRYKTLEDGRRQILNYSLAGDLLGLQGAVSGAMDHSVEALSPVVLCVFQRGDLESLFREHPGLAYDVTWLAAREERMLDEHLLSVGRRSALERAAYLLSFLHQRAVAVGASPNRRLLLPLGQQHVADTLGMSLVHTNKTLRQLARRGLIKWHDRACEILEPEALLAVSGWPGLGDDRRPFI